MRFMSLIGAAAVGFVVAVLAGALFARLSGWSDNYDLLLPADQSVVRMVRWIVWAIATFVLDGLFIRWRARRMAARMPTVIIVGAPVGPIKRAPGLLGQTFRFILLLAVGLFALLYYVAWRRG